MNRPILKRVVALAALCAGLASAADAGATDPTPWAERTSALSALSQQPDSHLDRPALDNLVEIGRQLFTAKYTSGDGAGRPDATQAIIPTKRRHPASQTFVRTSGIDASACASCHNEPVTGGAGDFTVNVFVSEGFESADFDSLDPQFSNERNTNHLFGAGLVELVAREMTADLRAERSAALKAARADGKAKRVALKTKGVGFGHLTARPDGIVDLDELDGVDTDLVIRPFSQKGVFTSLRQFTINALNQHHGMEAAERFGARWTDTPDFDGDGHDDEMTAANVSALVAWQATRPAPGRKVPENARWQAAASRGEKQFSVMGCDGCHRPALPLDSLAFEDPGPFDASGTLNDRQVKSAAVYDLALYDWAKTLPRDDKGRILVPLFGDLKRHVIADNQVASLGNEILSQRFVDRDVFMTAELWGIGSTAPYGHRGDMTTLDTVIRAHGGSAREARDAYIAADEKDRSAIIAFLKTLVIDP